MDYDKCVVRIFEGYGGKFLAQVQSLQDGVRSWFLSDSRFFFQCLSFSLNQDLSVFFFNVDLRSVSFEYCSDSIHILKIVFNR